MFSFKPSVLSFAIAFISLPTVVNSASANCASDSSFINDVKLDGKVQTIYYDAKEINNQTSKGAWTGAIWLNAQTGYLADIMSFGVSAYRVAKFSMKDTHEDSNNLLNANNNGFGKIGQAWVDLKLPTNSDAINADIKIGRQAINTGLLSTSESRSVPSAWSGVDATIDAGTLKGKIAWVNEVSQRTQSGFHSITNDLGNKIDWIGSVQLSYTLALKNEQSLEFQYNNALAHHYVNGHNGNVIYKTPLQNNSNLTLTGLYYHANKKGDLWQWENDNAPFDKDAHSGSVSAVLENGPWTFNAGVTMTRAKSSGINNKYQTIGHYEPDFGSNTRGTFDAPTAATISDFNFDKEVAWIVGAEYDFSSLGIEGLSVSYKFAYGSGMKARNNETGSTQDVHESETDLQLIYNFKQPILQGLKFKTEYAYYKNDTAFALATDQNGIRDLRAWLSYDFSI